MIACSINTRVWLTQMYMGHRKQLHSLHSVTDPRNGDQFYVQAPGKPGVTYKMGTISYMYALFGVLTAKRGAAIE